MTLEEKIKQKYKNLKAPKGKFAVCIWDPSNPQKSIPRLDGRPYFLCEKAIEYVRIMNKKEASRQALGINAYGEKEYFVLNDEGLRIY